ncbi:hypothetical protein I316_04792 [Kwoniella heveanensis BCC8398]|uniref:Uncharacterized protein n=1 Tax=Kwoniella heveanensis BCC8398 TaxID=1296120 RepID=A0A1B9GQS6_9TREE|nr:hypothetical protein I316_04792 [Kwoniella heveanensis BCC8398]
MSSTNETRRCTCHNVDQSVADMYTITNHRTNNTRYLCSNNDKQVAYYTSPSVGYVVTAAPSQSTRQTHENAKEKNVSPEDARNSAREASVYKHSYGSEGEASASSGATGDYTSYVQRTASTRTLPEYQRYAAYNPHHLANLQSLQTSQGAYSSTPGTYQSIQEEVDNGNPMPQSAIDPETDTYNPDYYAWYLNQPRPQ